MKLSTRSRYGVRLMLNLAFHYGQGAFQLNQIAQAEGISEKYLSQIVIHLRNKGLLTSSRGSHGGHTLAKHPRNITLKDIVEAVDGEVVLVDCLKGEQGCDRGSECLTQEIWGKLGKTIASELEQVTLQTLIDRQMFKNAELLPDNYVI